MGVHFRQLGLTLGNLEKDIFRINGILAGEHQLGLLPLLQFHGTGCQCQGIGRIQVEHLQHQLGGCAAVRAGPADHRCTGFQQGNRSGIVNAGNIRRFRSPGNSGLRALRLDLGRQGQGPLLRQIHSQRMAGHFPIGQD